MDSATTKKVIGVVLVVLGICLAYWAHSMSGSVGSQLNQAINGSPTDRVMMFYIGAVISAAVGVFLLVKK